MFQGRWRGVPREIQGRFKGGSQGYIKEKFKGFFKGVSWQFQIRFKEVSRVFKESVKCVPRKFQIKFQECFNGVFFCNFVVAWISSHLPEQKEGLFSKHSYLIVEEGSAITKCEDRT